MKFLFSTITLLSVVLFANTLSSIAQTSVITEQVYWAGIRGGFQRTREIYPRKETRSYESFSDGKTDYLRTEVSEYLDSTNYRIVKTSVVNGKTTVSEVIQMGKSRYCRENAGEWKSTGCYPQPPAALGDSDETKYEVETNADAKTYIRIARLTKKEKDGSEPVLFITEDRFVLNTNMSVRERSIVNTNHQTNNVVSREMSKFEYGIRLDPIEAPIK